VKQIIISLFVIVGLAGFQAQADVHPNLMLTANSAKILSTNLGRVPLLDSTFERALEEIAPYLESQVDVPLPKDAGGGYTHERHKKNGQAIQQAGFLYQITGDKKYLLLVQDLLMRYTELYPTLGKHPEHKHQSPGKLFWQILNDAVWLVYVIQGYDAVLLDLRETDRQTIETQLLRPYVDYLSVESSKTFNKIHNHGTWAAAAVGMTGLTLNDQHMLDIALKGSNKDGSTGFLKQMDMLFSPDGYYTEGPYYQRYAMMPFLVFARALDNKQPDYKIFAYRDQVLLKAVYAAINLSYNNLFFPLNDAIKDKGLDTIEMVYGVDIAYALTGDAGLLSVAKDQGQVLLSGDGLEVARAIAAGKTEEFHFTSQVLRDGAEGESGGVVVLREKNSALVLKAASQGMGHGHFDRLAWLYYDNDAEVVSDYGAVRFLNVVTKRGGVYLPENKTWGKHTVAHNTLVVDGASQFDGKVKLANKTSSKLLAFSPKPGLQIVSAREDHAYPGVALQRTMIMASPQALQAPLILDLFDVKAKDEHQYDLPLHYQGHLTYLNAKPKVALNKLLPLGGANGYQHLWNKGEMKVAGGSAQVTWLQGNRFYSSTNYMPRGASVILAELGANDPEFNLRRESSFIVRYPKMAKAQFFSVLESHGEYNGSREFTLQPKSKVAGVEIERIQQYRALKVKFVNGGQYTLVLADDMQAGKQHTLRVGEKSIRWQGPASSFEEVVDDKAQ